MVYKKRLTAEQQTEKDCDKFLTSEWNWIFGAFDNCKNEELRDLAAVEKSFIPNQKEFVRRTKYTSVCLICDEAKRVSKTNKAITCTEAYKYEKIGRIQVFTFAYGSKDGVISNMTNATPDEPKKHSRFRITKSLVCKPTPGGTSFLCEYNEVKNEKKQTYEFTLTKKIKDGKAIGKVSNFQEKKERSPKVITRMK